MATIHKIGDDYFLCKKKRGLYRGTHMPQNKWTPLFKTRAIGKYGTYLNIGNNLPITCPKELFGKKIMFKVVFVDNRKL